MSKTRPASTVPSAITTSMKIQGFFLTERKRLIAFPTGKNTRGDCPMYGLMTNKREVCGGVRGGFVPRVNNVHRGEESSDAESSGTESGDVESSGVENSDVESNSGESSGAESGDVTR